MHARRDVEDGRLHEGSATLSALVEHERVLRDDAVDAVGDHEGVEVDTLDDVGHDEQLGAAVHRRVVVTQMALIMERAAALPMAS